MVRRFFLTSGNWPRTTDCVVAEQVSVPAAAANGALLRRRFGAGEMDAGCAARTSPAAAPERAVGVESAAAAGCCCSESCSFAIAFLRSQLDSPPRQMDMKVIKVGLGTLLASSLYPQNSVVMSLCRAWRPQVKSGHVVAMDEKRNVLSFIEFDFELNSDFGLGWRVSFVRLCYPEGFLLSNELIAVAFGVLSP